jgi:hypothetical protein
MSVNDSMLGPVLNVTHYLPFPKCHTVNVLLTDLHQVLCHQGRTGYTYKHFLHGGNFTHKIAVFFFDLLIKEFLLLALG